MKSIKEYDIKNEYNIKVFMGNYNKREFYSWMGEFFADRKYRKKMPYLINDVDKIWYVIYERRDKIVGFFGIKICLDNTLISDIYIDENYNRMSIFEYMAKYLVELYQEETIKVLTKMPNEQIIWSNLSFTIIGNRGNYAIMTRKVKNEKN